MTLPKLYLGLALRALLVIPFAWSAYICTPLGSPNALPTARPVIWLLFGCFALGSLLFAYLTFAWLRRQLLIYQLTQLVYEKTGGRDNMSLVFPGGQTGYLTVYDNMITLVISDGFDSWSYNILGSYMFGMLNEREPLLHADNRVDGPLRWLTNDHVSLVPVNERQLARALYQFIKNQRLS